MILIYTTLKNSIFHRANWSKILTNSKLCLLPTSKSLKSCAGVIFTAPEPFSGSAYSSAIIGICFSTIGSVQVFPIKSLSGDFIAAGGRIISNESYLAKYV